MEMLREKYVFHIPLYRDISGKLEAIEIDDVLDELIESIGADSFYITNVKSHYNQKSFDEILITIFTNQRKIEEIFSRWFEKNNNILCQESYAYEHNNTLIIKNP